MTRWQKMVQSTLQQLPLNSITNGLHPELKMCKTPYKLRLNFCIFMFHLYMKLRCLPMVYACAAVYGTLYEKYICRQYFSDGFPSSWKDTWRDWQFHLCVHQSYEQQCSSNYKQWRSKQRYSHNLEPASGCASDCNCGMLISSVVKRGIHLTLSCKICLRSVQEIICFNVKCLLLLPDSNQNMGLRSALSDATQ